MSDLQQRLDAAETIAASGAEVALGYFRNRGALSVESKGPRDFVSQADRGTEDAVRKILSERFPGEKLIGEESGGGASGDYWLLDPIDGTTNFLNGLPLWAVSLAFVSGGEPILGVVCLPVLGERLSAGSGLGLRIAPSPSAGASSPAGHGAAGIGRNGRWPAPQRFALEQAVEASGLSVLCLGSCATSLALVATNRLAGYAERFVRPWDVAAGQVLCSEAQLAVAVCQTGRDVDIAAGSDEFVRLCRTSDDDGLADKLRDLRVARK